VGRYATNIKEPIGYFLPKIKIADVPSYIKAVGTDNPTHTWAKHCEGDNQDTLGIGARTSLYREMFDLPAFGNLPHPAMEKVGEKEYRLTAERSEFTEIPTRGKSGVAGHHILGGVYLQSSEQGRHEFRDKWDIVTSGEERGEVAANDVKGGTRNLRLLVAKFLKPATVVGVIPPEAGGEGGVAPQIRELRRAIAGKTPHGSPGDVSEKSRGNDGRGH
jgi:hypothetical protein